MLFKCEDFKQVFTVHNRNVQNASHDIIINNIFTDTEVNNCFIIPHRLKTSGPKSNFICYNIPTKAILFFFACSEVNSTWLINSGQANQRARKVLFTCVVYTNCYYCIINEVLICLSITCHLCLCKGWYVSLANSVVYAIAMLYFLENTRICRCTITQLQEYMIPSRRVEHSGIVPVP